MMKHFGVNQLTSYAFTEYKALRDKIEDKLYTCQQHKGPTQEIQKIRDKLKTVLLRQYNFEEKYGDQNDNLPEKQRQRKQAIEEKINELSAVLSELEQQRSTTTK